MFHTKEEFPQPLIPVSHIMGFTLQESRVGTVLFWPMWLVQTIKPILKYSLACSLPLLIGF